MFKSTIRIQDPCTHKPWNLQGSTSHRGGIAATPSWPVRLLRGKYARTGAPPTSSPGQRWRVHETSASGSRTQTRKLTTYAWTIALAYGVLKTGFTEELLFRGLLAGSLQRRMPLWAANLLQAVIFFIPHLLMVVYLAPGLWQILFSIFISSLLMGWLRMKSGSILGPWIMHAATNTTVAMMVATHGG